MQSLFLRLYPDQVPALEAGLHLYPKAVEFWFELQRHPRRRLRAQSVRWADGGREPGAARLPGQEGRARAKSRARLQDPRPDELDQIAPYLGPAVVGAELCADEGRLDALKANTALRRWVRRVGVMVTGETSVDRVSRDGGRFKLDTSRGTVRAATLVIAAGPGSLTLAEPFGLTLPVESEPLHMNITEPTDLFIGHLVQHADRMITVKQLSSGHVVIGGGWPADLSPSEDYAAVRLSSIIGNTSLAQHIVPAIGRLRIIRTWAASTPRPAVPASSARFTAHLTRSWRFRGRLATLLARSLPGSLRIRCSAGDLRRTWRRSRRVDFGSAGIHPITDCP